MSFLKFIKRENKEKFPIFKKLIIDCDYQSFNTPVPCNDTYKINNNKLSMPFKHIWLIIGHMPVLRSFHTAARTDSETEPNHSISCLFRSGVLLTTDMKQNDSRHGSFRFRSGGSVKRPLEQSYLDQCMTVNGHNFDNFNHSIILV